MSSTRSTAEKAAYCQAASTGKYEKPSGLLGKYDNVRRFWEDRVTARFLVQALNNLAKSQTQSGKRLSILDLGCGSGDGIELLTGVDCDQFGLSDVNTAVLCDDSFERYVGLDLNEDLLQQAEICHRGNPKLRFMQGDLSHGLPQQCKELEPFDFYFAGYGTLSHFHDDKSATIIADICRHAPDGAVFVGDWLGRYSYEWQDLWHNPADKEYFMDYRISYIYEEQDRPHVDIASFPLRLMTRDEIMAVISKVETTSGAKLEPLIFFDRSVLIGRHMDTADYNKHCPKIRVGVNSLFEQNLRTDLDSLRFKHSPRSGFDWQNEFFDSFFRQCNQLVEHTQDILTGLDPVIDDSWSTPLKEAATTMKQMVHVVGEIGWCDGRANVIEPMLGYCLRKLEMELQPGMGMGHGLVGVFKIHK